MELQAMGPEDFSRLEAKIDAVDKKLDELLERQRWQKDMVDEFAPIVREAVKVGADKLHGLDQAGYFAFGREAMRVMSRIVESYSEDDVRQLGDHIVGIMDTVKNVTQPAILSVANDATAVLSDSDEVEPMGVVGMVKASQDEDVKKGTAIMFEILRQIGRTAGQAAPAEAEARPVCGARPKARPAAANGHAKPTNGANGHPKPAEAPAAPANDAPNGAANGGRSGWELGDDGHLLDANEWSETFAAAMAGSLGIGALTPEQWTVVQFARNEWLETKAAPNVRRLGAGAGLETRELYKLFPKAPARTVAKIAGLPKPAGCI